MALPRPTTPEEDGAFFRIPRYNIRPGGIGTDNEYGFGEDGYLDNQMRQANDVAIVARYTLDLATGVAEDADRFEAAVAAIEAGPVTSVNGRSGAVSGLVETSDFSSLETELRGDVQDAIDALPDKASGTDLRALTNDTRFLTSKTNADAMTFVTAAATATIAPDFALGFNRLYTMGLNATLGQPSNLKDGLPVVLYFVQDATGGRTISFASTYHKFAGGVVPALSTAANAIDRLSGICRNRAGTLVVEWANLEKDIR